jgi:hypothetical protein
MGLSGIKADVKASREQMNAAYSDQFYFDKVKPDENAFIDFDNIVFSIGEDVPMVLDGKVTKLD